jgi:hypothetical protein
MPCRSEEDVENGVRGGSRTELVDAVEVWMKSVRSADDMKVRVRVRVCSALPAIAKNTNGGGLDV